MSKSLSDMYTNQVLFGKYSGVSVDSLLETDPEYLYFLAKENLVTLKPDAKSVLLEKLGFTKSNYNETIYNLGDVPF